MDIVVIAEDNALLNMLGLTLIERSILSFKECGAKHIYVICDNEIKNFLKEKFKDVTFLNRMERKENVIVTYSNIVFRTNSLKKVIRTKKRVSNILTMLKTYKIEYVIVKRKEDIRKAEKLLLKGLIKTTDGPVSRYINRRISLKITKYLLRTPITPNHVSILTLLLAFISSYLFILNNYLTIAIAGLLAQFLSILDGCDGEIARIKFKTSNYGAWLDAVIDRYTDAILLFSITYIMHNSTFFIIGIIAIIGTLIHTYSADKYKAEFRKYRSDLSILRISRDVRIFIIMISSIFNILIISLIVIAILTNLDIFRRIIAWRES